MSQTAIIQETIVHAIYNGLCLTSEGQPCVIQNVDFGKLADLVDAALHAKAGVSVEEKGLDRETLAVKFQNIMARCLNIEPLLYEIEGTGQASFEMADTAISALSTTLQEPVAWQMRSKDRQFGFDPDIWITIVKSEYERNPDLWEYRALYTSPPTLAHQPVTAGWEEAIDAAMEAYREGIYLTEEQALASVTSIVRAALAALKSEGRK